MNGKDLGNLVMCHGYHPHVSTLFHPTSQNMTRLPPYVMEVQKAWNEGTLGYMAIDHLTCCHGTHTLSPRPWPSVYAKDWRQQRPENETTVPHFSLYLSPAWSKLAAQLCVPQGFLQLLHGKVGA